MSDPKVSDPASSVGSMNTATASSPTQFALPLAAELGGAEVSGTLLHQATFCVVDLETTGNGESQITEFGAVKVRGGEVIGEFQTLVNPGTHIPLMVANLTGINDAMVASAPRLGEVLPSFLEFSRGCVLVAHNAGFDVGHLRRACTQLGYRWPNPPVLDTLQLARQVLLPGEVRNHKLGTLAALVGSPVVPNHRALADAQATVAVLHHLIARLGNRGVHTVEELAEHSRRVSPKRRAKKSLADGVPAEPGVYLFTRGTGADREVLYVGRSVNLRRRVASYFTAAEKRRRIEEMVTVAERVEPVVCSTALEAEVTELRMIAQHRPRYNRRSKNPARGHWVKLTDEPFPRLSIVRQVRDDATYLGPYSRDLAEEVVAALHDSFRLRQCTDRLSAKRPSSPCALKELGRCAAPCDRTVSAAGYDTIVEAVRTAMVGDGRAVEAAVWAHLEEHAAAERYEAAAVDRDRHAAWQRALVRHHRVAALAACPEIVACAPATRGWGTGGWEIHAIRYGRLVGATVARRGEYPPAVTEELRPTLPSVPEPLGPLPAGTDEEARQIAAWLEQPGVRLLSVQGDWQWPLHLNGRAVTSTA